MSSTRAALSVLVLLALAPASARADDGTLYVGDSLGVGTVRQLRSTTAGATLEVDTRVGRSSTKDWRCCGRGYAGGTRSWCSTWGRTTAARTCSGRTWIAPADCPGERTLIVFTLNKPGARPFNSAIRTFAPLGATTSS